MPTEATCATCAAFIKVETTAEGKKVGECALEVFRGSVSGDSTCTRYRPKGALGAAERPRAAGEPRKYAASRPVVRGGDRADTQRGGLPASSLPASSLPASSLPASSLPATSLPATSLPVTPLPKEIDIDMDIDDFRRVLRQVLSEELGVSRTEMGSRWKGGEIVLRPGKEGTQDKRIPIDTFFHKIVMVRDKLRVLEAKVNAHDGLSADDKVQLQAYITGCYGSLTTFNVLFADREDQFSGSGSRDGH